MLSSCQNCEYLRSSQSSTTSASHSVSPSHAISHGWCHSVRSARPIYLELKMVSATFNTTCRHVPVPSSAPVTKPLSIKNTVRRTPQTNSQYAQRPTRSVVAARPMSGP